MTDLEMIAARARAASKALARLTMTEKNDCLNAMADAVCAHCAQIISENEKDVIAARAKGMREQMIDRLMLNEKRVFSMAQGMREVAALADPVGRVLGGGTPGNGLKIERVSVPFGVVAIIYEARPNVTGDAAALCFKSGNACILRGGSEAIRSSIAIAEAMRGALSHRGVNPDAIQLLTDTNHETAQALMRMNGKVDLLIPRGSARLIRSVVENATVPVIETGVGNCHIYVEKTADIDMAASIVYNAKTSRTSVCNAAESLLVDRAIAPAALPVIAERLRKKHVEIRGCEETCAILPDAISATEEDYGTEYLDMIISVKVVGGIDEAIAHIDRYSTHHSEAIVTRDYAAARKFTSEVDSAAVYVNASTRFTDGGEFGLGAEIGISTQKLHARGPMGLEQLVTYKYIIFGDGQIRV